jgi:hypothetical protein
MTKEQLEKQNKLLQAQIDYESRECKRITGYESKIEALQNEEFTPLKHNTDWGRHLRWEK